MVSLPGLTETRRQTSCFKMSGLRMSWRKFPSDECVLHSRGHGKSCGICWTVEVERLIAAVPEEAELRVQVNVSYRTSRRGVDRATLNELATSLRNIDDGEIAVKAKDGRRVGDEVWLQQPMTFQRVNDNGDLLDLEDTRRQLGEVHRRFCTMAR